MPDHVHGLLMFPKHVTMKNVVDEWKESAARRAGVHWQRDFFDHRLRNDEHEVEKAHYIRMNPVRRGLIDKPEDWPYVWKEDMETERPDTAVGPYQNVEQQV